MSSLQTASQGYDRFRSFLENACGILLGDNKEYLVKSRLKALMTEHKFSDLNQLVDVLESRSSMALRERVVDAMTTNETLWFRDLHPFRILEERIFPNSNLSLNLGP